MMRALRLAPAMALLLTPALGAQVPGPGAAQPAASEKVTLTGCLHADREGGGFVLTDVKPSAAGSKDSPLTSAGAGTSATGQAPSGSVSGETPTGSTATSTGTSTPAAGTPSSSANPASPGYNRGDVSAGTTGTVPRPETPESSPVRTYRLMAAPGVQLSAHAGDTVLIRGRLQPTPAPASTDAGSGSDAPRGSATAEPTAQMREPVVETESVQHVATGCRR